VIAGGYSDVNMTGHGFVRAVDGTITVFDAPDGANARTLPSINDTGSSPGHYAIE